MVLHYLIYRSSCRCIASDFAQMSGGCDLTKNWARGLRMRNSWHVNSGMQLGEVMADSEQTISVITAGDNSKEPSYQATEIYDRNLGRGAIEITNWIGYNYYNLLASTCIVSSSSPGIFSFNRVSTLSTTRSNLAYVVR